MKLHDTMTKLIINLFCLTGLTVSFMSSVAFASDNSRSIYPEDKITNQVEQDHWQYYKLELDSPAKLTIKLRKISDDVDLYVSKEQKPTTSDYLCAPRKPGNLIETCRLNSAEAEVIYIGIYGKAESDYQLGVNARKQKLLSWSDYK